MPIMVMIGNNIEAVKAYAMDQLQSKQLWDHWCAGVLDAIQLNSRINIYCSQCRELGHIQFSTHDEHWIAECESCGFLYNNLDTELADIMRYNAIKHKADLYEMREKLNE